MTKAVFLDRDGVLNDPVHDPHDGRPESPLRADDVVLADGAVDGCLALEKAGFTLAVVSNQPGAAKGKASLADLSDVHGRVAELLTDAGVLISDWRYCHHHPEAVDPKLRGPCDCRKPAPGMLLAAASAGGYDLGQSWMVGDSDGDIEAGQRAGCRTVLVEHPGSGHRRSDASIPTARVRNLRDGAAFITRTVSRPAMRVR